MSLSRELKQGINCLLRAAGDGRGRIGIDDHLYSTLLSVSSAPQRRIGTTAPGKLGRGKLGLTISDDNEKKAWRTVLEFWWSAVA